MAHNQEDINISRKQRRLDKDNFTKYERKLTQNNINPTSSDEESDTEYHFDITQTQQAKQIVEPRINEYFAERQTRHPDQNTIFHYIYDNQTPENIMQDDIKKLVDYADPIIIIFSDKTPSIPISSHTDAAIITKINAKIHVLLLRDDTASILENFFGYSDDFEFVVPIAKVNPKGNIASIQATNEGCIMIAVNTARYLSVLDIKNIIERYEKTGILSFREVAKAFTSIEFSALQDLELPKPEYHIFYQELNNFYKRDFAFNLIYCHFSNYLNQLKNHRDPNFNAINELVIQIIKETIKENLPMLDEIIQNFLEPISHAIIDKIYHQCQNKTWFKDMSDNMSQEINSYKQKILIPDIFTTLSHKIEAKIKSSNIMQVFDNKQSFSNDEYQEKALLLLNRMFQEIISSVAKNQYKKEAPNLYNRTKMFSNNTLLTRENMNTILRKTSHVDSSSFLDLEVQRRDGVKHFLAKQK